MPNRISQGLITKAILEGITNAEETYEKWADGETLAFTAEHVLYGFIANSIMKIPGSKYVEIEPQCKKVIKSACGNGKRKLPQATRPNGHIDMLLWWANGLPRGVIEIKHNVYNYDGQCEKDIKRITKILRMSRTKIQFGIFAFYSSASPGKRKTAKEKLEDRFKSIKLRIEGYCRSNFLVDSDKKIKEYKDIDNNISAWSAAYILIKPRK